MSGFHAYWVSFSSSLLLRPNHHAVAGDCFPWTIRLRSRSAARRRHGASRRRRTLQHDAAVDAVLLAARDENLIACREVAKHSWCLQGTGAPITPDGMIVPTEGTVVHWDAHSQEEAARPASLATQRETLDGSRW
jgi:hypothetical protein